MPQLHYTTTPVMGMSLPVPGVTDALGKEAPGASWMELQNSAFGILDQHNHAPGSGAAVPSSGLTINADLPFQVHNATQLRAAKFTAQSSTLAPATDTAALYVSGQDLYFNDVGGNVVRLTASGGVAGTPGSIAGLTSPAAATYTPASKLFDLTSGSGVRANLWTGPLSIYDPQAAGHKATLQVPVGLGADYSLTLPSALPGSTLPLFLASSGQLSTGQIQTVQIANLAVTTTQIASSAGILGSQLATGAGILGSQLASSAGILGTQLANSTITNTQQNFGTPSATTDVAIKSYVDAVIIAAAQIHNDGTVTSQKGFTVSCTKTGTGTYSVGVAGLVSSSIVLASPQTIVAKFLSAGVPSSGTVLISSFDSAGNPVDGSFYVAVLKL